MALRSFQLFIGQVENSPPELKVQVLKVLLDLLIVYDQEFFKNSEAIVSVSRTVFSLSHDHFG